MGLLKLQADCCEVTGVIYPLHLHHVLFRSHGGDDVRANIICLSEGFHGRYHAGDAKVRKRFAEYLRVKRPDTIAYLALKLGAGGRDYWLERHGIPLEDL